MELKPEPAGTGQSQLRRPKIREPLESRTSQAGMPVFDVSHRYMKKLFLALLFVTGILAGEEKIIFTENPLVGRWEVDIEKTRESRKNLKELPLGIKIKPKPEDVRPRTVIFTESTYQIQMGTSLGKKNSYRVLKREDNRILLEYFEKEKAQSIYTWWELIADNKATNYLLSVDLNSPALTDRKIPTFYNKMED